MALQLLIAVPMVVATLMFHVAGLAGLLVLIPPRGHRLGVRRALLAEAGLVLLVVNGLFLLHMSEVLAYALLYRFGGAIPTFHEAFVFSAANYATLGSDVVVPHGWRLVGAMEGANGIILLGFSTAFFVSVVARIRELLDEWLGRA
jgi:voltage-gated potassium channel